MEKQTKTLFILLIVGTILFDLLFWKESHGMNLLIFDVFILISVYIIGYRPLKAFISSVLTISLLASAIAVASHSSAFTIVMHYISLVLIIGTFHLEGLNSLVFVVSSSFTSFFKFPVELFSKMPKQRARTFKRVFKILKLSLIPIFILWLFYVIYINANPVFNKLSFQFLDKLVKLIAPLFNNISILHILFILLGFALSAWVLFKTGLGHIIVQQNKMLEILSRKRKIISEGEKQSLRQLREKAPIYYNERYKLKMKLKYESISAFVLLVLINILLLVVNMIDIKWVWFGFEYSEKFDMKQFVHEGTYLLIISILLSMGIMLYFFRKNLNFYKKARFIKILTYSWIGQNLILAISVAIRNFRYIDYWGLAYKRIGVIMFLIAVIFGLITLYIKIKHTKTAYYLIKRNLLAVYAIILVSSLLNWDTIIAKHNLNHPFKNHMEASYLLSLSDKVLPMIDSNQEILNQELMYNSYASYYPLSYKQYYDLRVKNFLKDYKKRSWVSWNYAEWKAYRFYMDKLESRNTTNKSLIK